MIVKGNDAVINKQYYKHVPVESLCLYQMRSEGEVEVPVFDWISLCLVLCTIYFNRYTGAISQEGDIYLYTSFVKMEIVKNDISIRLAKTRVGDCHQCCWKLNYCRSEERQRRRRSLA